jgi:hypothetical protein
LELVAEEAEVDLERIPTEELVAVAELMYREFSMHPI